MPQRGDLPYRRRPRQQKYCRAAYARFIRLKKLNNPFEGFEAFDEFPRTRYLTQEEMAALLQAVNQSLNKMLPVIVRTAIVTGMRKQEILGLHVRDIDFGHGTITVTADRKKGKKTKVIHLVGELVEELRKLAAISVSGYVFESPRTRRPLTDVKKAFRARPGKGRNRRFPFP
jgi:integrase